MDGVTPPTNIRPQDIQPGEFAQSFNFGMNGQHAVFLLT
jgi:hypothetical protein